MLPHYLVEGYIFGASVLHQVWGVESSGGEQPAPWKWYPMSPASVTPFRVCLGLFVLERANPFSGKTLHPGSRLPNPKPHHLDKGMNNHQLMAMAWVELAEMSPLLMFPKVGHGVPPLKFLLSSTHARAELQKDRTLQDENPQTRTLPLATSLYCSHGAPSPDIVWTWNGPNRLPSLPGRDQLDWASAECKQKSRLKDAKRDEMNHVP
jgi:hypothetical protein